MLQIYNHFAGCAILDTQVDGSHLEVLVKILIGKSVRRTVNNGIRETVR